LNDETTEQTENRLIAERREKLGELRSRGIAFPNDFRRDSVAGELHAGYDGHTNESLEQEGRVVRVDEDGIAVEFLNVSREMRDRLKRFVMGGKRPSRTSTE